MRRNAFGEETIETDADWARCTAYQSADTDLHAGIVDGGLEDGPDERFYAEIRQNVSGDTVASIRGFPTKDELIAFIKKNAPDLEIVD